MFALFSSIIIYIADDNTAVTVLLVDNSANNVIIIIRIEYTYICYILYKCASRCADVNFSPLPRVYEESY